MINKEIEKLKKKLNFDKGCHVLGYITGDKDETISIEEIENILQYIDQLEKTVKRLEFQDKANKKVHDYDVNMIDKVKGESVEQYKKIRELEDKVKEFLEYIKENYDGYKIVYVEEDGKNTIEE